MSLGAVGMITCMRYAGSSADDLWAGALDICAGILDA